MTSYKNNYKNTNDIVPYWVIKIDEIIDSVKNESPQNLYQPSEKYIRSKDEGL